MIAVHEDVGLQPLAEGVDHRDADAVQAAGDLVAAAAELAARVQHGEDDLGGRLAVLLHDAHGDAAAVVDDGDGVVWVDGHGDAAGSDLRAPRRPSCRPPRRRGGAGRAVRWNRCTCRAARGPDRGLPVPGCLQRRNATVPRALV